MSKRMEEILGFVALWALKNWFNYRRAWQEVKNEPGVLGFQFSIAKNPVSEQLELSK
jgi:hypothetical protein